MLHLIQATCLTVVVLFPLSPLQKQKSLHIIASVTQTHKHLRRLTLVHISNVVPSGPKKRGWAFCKNTSSCANWLQIHLECNTMYVSAILLMSIKDTSIQSVYLNKQFLRRRKTGKYHNVVLMHLNWFCKIQCFCNLDWMAIGCKIIKPIWMIDWVIELPAKLLLVFYLGIIQMALVRLRNHHRHYLLCAELRNSEGNK